MHSLNCGHGPCGASQMASKPISWPDGICLAFFGFLWLSLHLKPGRNHKKSITPHFLVRHSKWSQLRSPTPLCLGKDFNQTWAWNAILEIAVMFLNVPKISLPAYLLPSPTLTCFPSCLHLVGVWAAGLQSRINLYYIHVTCTHTCNDLI